MGFNSRSVLDSRKDLLLSIGYLAMVSNLRGIYARGLLEERINGFELRSDIRDVVVGDYAYDGLRFGLVESITLTGSSGEGEGEGEDSGYPTYSVVVVYKNDILPDGLQVDDVSGNLLTQTYHVSLEGGSSGLVQGLSFSKLDNLGVVFVKPVGDFSPYTVELTGDPSFVEGGGFQTFEFLYNGLSPFNDATVTVYLNDEVVVEDLTNSSGEVTFRLLTALEDDVVKIRLEKDGYGIFEFGPYVVGPAA